MKLFCALQKSLFLCEFLIANRMSYTCMYSHNDHCRAHGQIVRFFIGYLIQMSAVWFIILMEHSWSWFECNWNWDVGCQAVEEIQAKHFEFLFWKQLKLNCAIFCVYIHWTVSTNFVYIYNFFTCLLQYLWRYFLQSCSVLLCNYPIVSCMCSIVP